MAKNTDPQPVPATPEPMHTRAHWKELGFRVPANTEPADIEWYTVPGYRSVERERHLFSRDQVVAIDPAAAAKRAASAAKALKTRMANMVRAMETAELTIVRGKTPYEIKRLAFGTHGGNYQGDPGIFHWSNTAARNSIRHCLTNYESQWALINRGFTGGSAYDVLRERVDALVDEAYPEYADGCPEVEVVRPPGAIAGTYNPPI